MSKKVKRLYKCFQPSHYELSLCVDKNTKTFMGRVEIIGKKTWRPNSRLVFHQKELKITNATIQKIDKKGTADIDVERINCHQSFNEVRLHTKSVIYPGEYKVSIDFTGKLTDSMLGIYPAYFEHNNTKKSIIATQFESHYAREAFVCIDEPEAKATFSLTITHSSKEVALSNTPVQATKVVKDVTTTTFEPTPKMSTYLLAFAVGEIHYVESKTKDNVEMRTWASVAQPLAHLEYANSEAVKILEYYTDYFGTAYPLKKCDQLALPDFESGAMENWGLITYREVALLADPVNRSVGGEQYVSLVIAHELSHQWFGNLVTMRWWDDLWLNESFASLMEHLCLDALHPDWQQLETFASNDILYCSNRDIYSQVQAVGVEVSHPDQISTLFDAAIVYAKGARLMKMLREFIGDDAFRAGLVQYFKKHAYGNTSRNDLWAVMSAASGQDIEAFMTPWLEQSGMPLLTIEQNNNKIQISQERFLLDTVSDGRLWPIPLLANQTTTHPNLITSETHTIEVKDQNSWLCNVNGSGHYIVEYKDYQAKQSLRSAIVDCKISSEARIVALSDMLLLARRGDQSITAALDVVAKCSQEPRDAVWVMILRLLGQAGVLTEGNDNCDNALKSLRVKLASNQFKTLGWQEVEAEDSNTKLLRQTMIAIMLGGEDPQTVTQALERYNKSENVEAMPADLRSMLVSVAVRHDKSVDIDKLISEYKSTHNPDVQHSICGGLTGTKDSSTASYIIRLALEEGGFVRTQDVFRWFAYLMRNKYTRELAWEWLTYNWQRLAKTLGDTKTFDDLPTYSAGPLNTHAWLGTYKAFFEPKLQDPVLERNIRIGISEIEARVAWRDRDEPNVVDWLGSRLR